VASRLLGAAAHLTVDAVLEDSGSRCFTSSEDEHVNIETDRTVDIHSKGVTFRIACAAAEEVRGLAEVTKKKKGVNLAPKCGITRKEERSRDAWATASVQKTVRVRPIERLSGKADSSDDDDDDDDDMSNMIIITERTNTSSPRRGVRIRVEGELGVPTKEEEGWTREKERPKEPETARGEFLGLR
ncbi:hypothetical protein FOZ60_001657, partial [Perkinsus olseni]